LLSWYRGLLIAKVWSVNNIYSARPLFSLGKRKEDKRLLMEWYQTSHEFNPIETFLLESSVHLHINLHT
jgi:hypothetical protein